ncbi:hypothetical protein G9A89_017114 [Geosiphon pyriformis]|nr:hypothetical protein G9A89_017114 [Geosiphon pyriformis]
MDDFADKVIIKDLVVRSILGVDSWEIIKRQPVVINVTIHTNISQAGETDHLPHSIHYGVVCKKVTKFAEESNYKSVEALADGIARVCIVDCHAPKVSVRVDKPRALLHASSAGVGITRIKEDYSTFGSHTDVRTSSLLSHQDFIFVKDLNLKTIIGVNPWEREEKQTVIVNLTIYPSFAMGTLQDYVPKPHNYHTIVRTISKVRFNREHVEESKYKTVEAFATALARIAITECHVSKITVRVEKPSALVFASSAGVEITRSISTITSKTLPQLNSIHKGFFRENVKPVSDTSNLQRSDIPNSFHHLVFIALGSNMGDTVDNINSALSKIQEKCNSKILDTSFLYETSPMHITDQARFLNAACKIITDLSPEELLQKLKAIEAEMGRFDVVTIRYGPRPIDLDIIFYDDIEYTSDTLSIPHPRMHEREFVLRPICDIAKGKEHPKLYKTCGQLLNQLLNSLDYDLQGNDIWRVIPIGKSKWRLGSKTFLMGVLNVTPDSFSDGGLYNNVDDAVTRFEKLVLEGADIIDIGGMSTRPNATDIPAEEELSRVLPVIQTIRAKGITNIPISIDTYRATVAERAIAAGADLINDVSGGMLDPEMFSVMANANIPVCLQHMRGDPKSMTHFTQYEDVIIDICYELSERVNHAIQAGVKRWNIIIDPGIGFAKDYSQNFQILRRLSDMISQNSPLEGFPCLLGPSRKGFIGHVIQQSEAKNRVWGTAAACTASVAGGVDILRVHDVKEMVDVVKVADSIWRDVARMQKGIISSPIAIFFAYQELHHDPVIECFNILRNPYYLRSLHR